MARVSSFTIFLWTTLVLYTILSGAVYAALQGEEYSSPYQTSLVEEGQQYQYSEIHNITKGGSVDYTTFSPDRRVRWNVPLHPDYLYFYRKDTWLGLVWFQMSNSPISEEDIIENFDTSKNYSKFVFDLGGQFQTDVYIYPYMASNGSFIYYPINESIANGKLTIMMGTNLTSYTYFDIGLLTGIVTGYASYGAPTPIAVIVGGIWWILFLLGIVKLVIG